MTQHLSRAAWNERCRDIEARPFPVSMAAMVDDATARWGERPALIFIGDETLSFEGLRRRVNRVANMLRARGVKRGDRVALMAPNLPAVPVVWLALAKLGAAIVWINMRYTSSELSYVLDDARPGHLLIHSDYLAVYDAIAEKPVELSPEHIITLGGPSKHDDFDALIARASEDFTPSWPTTPDDIVNINYTSGTTGFPKGCMLPQLYWQVFWACKSPGFPAPPGRTIYNQNLFYIDGPMFLSLTLHTGAAMAIMPRPSLTGILERLRDQEIDYLYFSEALMRQGDDAAARACGLKLVHIFGLTPALHAEVEQRFGCVAREAFGMTETGAALMMPWEVTDMVGSVGWPVTFREASVRDPDFNLLGPGETGELWLAGKGMMTGYWNRDETNAESFRAGWFRTGDLFQTDEAGYLTLVGRLKEMIRRNSENIAVREVETVLRAIDGIAEAAVVAVPDERVGEEVKLYVVLENGLTSDDVTPELILEHARRHLAPFKVPRYIAYATSFPKTESDRVEKKKLTAGIEDLRTG
ncbi:MAG: acyl--CoA ligase, partial [Rhodospirillaceae bacterium]|nr:acyl--CoA ligase [Rhodospirillaceae bacterium]